MRIVAKKLYNCHITGICSSKNADFVRGMGADEVIDYTTQDVAKALLDARPRGRKFDLYIDCVGGVEIFKRWVGSIRIYFRTREDADVLSMTSFTEMPRL